jgi:hypothetical protein
MNFAFRQYVAFAATVMIIGGSALLPAQKGPYTITVLAPGGPAPRTPDGHPDLSGVWFPNSAGRWVIGLEGVDPAARRQFDPKLTPEEKPPYQPSADAKIKALTPTELELQRNSVNCIPRGVPAIWLQNPYTIRIIQTPGMMFQLFEVLNNHRTVHTDGRPHAKNFEPLIWGDGVGRWEGDTLIVDTVSFDPRTFVMPNGWFHSDQLHVVERYTRPSKNFLVVQITVEDPKVLTKPWMSAPRRWSLGNEDQQEYFCTGNQEVEQLQSLKELESQRK